MSFQIRDIVLYGPEETPQVLSLNVGGVSVITGGSKTGKSALIDIVDYCCGGSCKVARGPIRSAVEWYALRLTSPAHDLFIARRAPVDGHKENSEVYRTVGKEIPIPQKSELVPNCNILSIGEELTRYAGIHDNLHIPGPGETRTALSAHIRHALFYCFLKQPVLLSNKHLFHKQDEQQIPQTIRDTLPYFLGAVNEDQVIRQRRLRELRRDMKVIELQIKELEDIKGGGQRRATQLLQEARDIGFQVIMPETDTWESILGELRRIYQMLPVSPAQEGGVDGQEYERLREETEQLVSQYRRVKDDLAATRAVIDAGRGYSVEAQIQLGRMRSIGLFQTQTPGQAECPLCRQALNDEPVHDQIKTAIGSLSHAVEGVHQEVPHLEKLVAEAEGRAAELKRQIDEKKAASAAMLKQRQRLGQLKELEARQAHVLGRVGLYLESVTPAPESPTELLRKRDQLQAQIDKLTRELGDETTADRLASILSRISKRLSVWARELQLEHSENPVRFDLNKLTVLIDSEEGIITFDEVGSALNHIGYHLALHMSLHTQFVRERRPVPHFLFIDQPSASQFPPEDDPNGELAIPGKDDDREQVRRLFEFIWRSVRELGGGMQVILTEHADLRRDPWFQDAVVARWRGEEKLIPAHWRKPGSSDDVDTSSA